MLYLCRRDEGKNPLSSRAANEWKFPPERVSLKAKTQLVSHFGASIQTQ
jgi:hypothetical protein